tara:strand:+ start:1495 stop:1737 length:243 start_codon:yes stop_codon:yes gene_type:complete
VGDGFASVLTPALVLEGRVGGVLNEGEGDEEAGGELDATCGDGGDTAELEDAEVFNKDDERMTPPMSFLFLLRGVDAEFK